MTNDNLLYAVPPHTSPTILSATSELTKYPKENVLTVTKPGRLWQTGAIDVDQVLEMSGFSGVNGLFLNNTNFSNLHLEKSTNGSTWDIAGPNLVRDSDNMEDGWTVNPGTVTRTAEYSSGPLSADRLATRCVWATANAVMTSLGGTEQAVVNRDFVGSIWMRTRDASLSETVQVGIRFTGVGDVYSTFTVSGTWQRLVVTRTATGASGTQATLIVRCPNGDEDMLAIGGQITPDVTEHIGADYMTVADSSSVRGIIAAQQMRTDNRVSRRKVLFRFGAGLTGYDYFRVNITQDQTTDDSENYTLGALLATSGLTILPGKHQYPISINVARARKKVDFDGGGFEMLDLGDSKAILTLRGTHIVREAEAAVLSIVTAGVGPFLIADNMRAAGRGNDSTDEARAYVAAITADFRSGFEMPELMGADLTFEEYI
jgi:hypothetical protein